MTPKPFRVPKGIKIRKVDLESGRVPNDLKHAIFEAFKDEEESSHQNFVESHKRKNIAELLTIDANFGSSSQQQNKDERNDDDGDSNNWNSDENELLDIKPVQGIY
jgi:hypothetical protein